MSVIGIPALAVVVVLAYLAAGRADDAATVRSTISTVFWVVVGVEIGFLPGLVDAGGGLLAALAGVVV